MSSKIPILTMQLIAAIPSIIFLICGWTGNIYVLITILRHRKYKTLELFHHLLAHLVIYDILTLLLYWPYQLNHIFNYWYFGNILCHICNGFTIFFNIASSLTIIAMAADHYNVVLNSSVSISKCGRKLTVPIIVVVISILLSLPSMIFAVVDFKLLPYAQSGDTIITIRQTCILSLPPYGSSNQKNESRLPDRIYYTAYYAILYLLPLVIVLILFFKLKHHFQSTIVVVDEQRVEIHKDVNKMILVLVLTLVATWTPLYVYYFILAYSKKLKVEQQHQSHLYQLIAMVIGISKCAINPVIYAYYLPNVYHPFLFIIKRKRSVPLPNQGKNPVRSNEIVPLLPPVEKVES